MKKFGSLFNVKNLKSLMCMHVGIVMLSVGVYFFKMPNGFTTGGVTGMGMILGRLTPVSTGSWIWILNAALLLLGFVFLGRKTGIKTVYCSMAYSALIYVLERFLPMTAPLSDQPFLELVYAMLLTSIGSAMIFYSGSSSGGTDIAALIIKKYLKLDVGKALLCTDFLVASSSFFIFDVKTGLFSLLGLFSKAFIVDTVIDNLNTCKYFVVITSKPEEIEEYIMKELHHGVTTQTSIGAYSHSSKTMLHTVCKRPEAIRLREKIKKIDPNAFVIITTSSEILGRGFRNV